MAIAPFCFCARADHLNPPKLGALLRDYRVPFRQIAAIYPRFAPISGKPPRNRMSRVRIRRRIARCMRRRCFHHLSPFRAFTCAIPERSHLGSCKSSPLPNRRGRTRSRFA
ncbi:hypothetical protein [Burkholderia ubonensis]|uniref:hypothetical protein n=1 Tax=Burkholderia ubonensis TaxID=101571 RepID=UPI000A644AE2|nr:hypothetical protein [Burkholderia ubonensis]